MRFVLVATVALILSGCTHAQIEHPIMSFFPSEKDRTAPDTTSDPQCAALAKQRAGDAAFSGEDVDTQRSVLEHAYADCINWKSKHGS